MKDLRGIYACAKDMLTRGSRTVTRVTIYYIYISPPPQLIIGTIKNVKSSVPRGVS